MDEAPIIMKITLPYKGVHKSMQSNTNSRNQKEKSKSDIFYGIGFNFDFKTDPKQIELNSFTHI